MTVSGGARRDGAGAVVAIAGQPEDAAAVARGGELVVVGEPAKPALPNPRRDPNGMWRALDREVMIDLILAS